QDHEGGLRRQPLRRPDRVRREQAALAQRAQAQDPHQGQGPPAAGQGRRLRVGRGGRRRGRGGRRGRPQGRGGQEGQGRAGRQEGRQGQGAPGALGPGQLRQVRALQGLCRGQGQAQRDLLLCRDQVGQVCAQERGGIQCVSPLSRAALRVNVVSSCAEQFNS